MAHQKAWRIRQLSVELASYRQLVQACKVIVYAICPMQCLRATSKVLAGASSCDLSDAALEGNIQSACRCILRAEDKAIQLHGLMYSAMTQTEADKARTAVICNYYTVPTDASQNEKESHSDVIRNGSDLLLRNSA